VFKRIFGKPDEDNAGMSIGRFVESQAGDGAGPDADSEHFLLPSKKPPPNVHDLVLPETLAQAATHPKPVDLSHVMAPPASPATVATSELTDAQIDAIAQRVADKLAAGVVGETLRQTVARIVSETSERLVREEIARIRFEAERE
jgi:hypothetical protein